MITDHEPLGLKQRQIRLLEEALERKREEADAIRRKKFRDTIFWCGLFLAALGVIAGNYALAKATGRIQSREQAQARADALDAAEYLD